TAGERRLGHNVNLAYFAQHQIEALDPKNRVIEELSRAIPPKIEVKPRDLLGRFLFSGDDTDKKVAVLSGGERTRLALAKMLVTPANMLCLDEPTNHLDIQSRDVLEDALVEYSGSMLLITHDRHLIRSVADLIFEVVAGKVNVHHSGYEEYLRTREPEIPTAGPATAAAVPEEPGLSAKERRKLAAEQRAKTKVFRDKIAGIEAKLDRLTAEQSRIEGVLGDPEAYTRGEDIPALSRDYEQAKKRIATLEAEWEAASGELEAAE
ncbi:MAG: ATP-binding cassette domain-containing protein, partial [Actinobacteria bacterium]|nr:ATP-binding cassette domain-containing protein [Actinomycetota bacterium]